MVACLLNDYLSIYGCEVAEEGIPTNEGGTRINVECVCFMRP